MPRNVSPDSNEKVLIVNADDFGLTESINRGILKCFNDGIVTSASIITNGRAFDEAVQLSKENNLNVGIHLTLMDGLPLSDPEDVKSLLNNDGRFQKDYLSFSLGYLVSRISLTDIEKELRAQVEKFINSGLIPSHINGHNHVHMFPGILDITLNLMKEFNIKNVRVPCSEISPALQNISLNSFAKLFLIYLSSIAKNRISKYGFSMPDNFEGLFTSGKLGKNDILKVIQKLKSGTTELMCHPGYNDKESADLYPWGYLWEEELNALCNHDIINKIKNSEIKLDSFK